MTKVFLDTSYAVALANPADSLHRQALRLAADLERRGSRMGTTRAILLEIGNSLARRRHLYRRGFGLFGLRADKDWGLVDCLSFVAMQDQGLQEALTADDHFEQAGFRALLRH
jgi:predicted nucleic acid-binding protein